MKSENLRMAMIDILISGTDTDSKVDQLMHVFQQYQYDGIIVGWLEVLVRPPDENEYIDIRRSNGTVLFERLATHETIQKMRQDSSLWRPHFAPFAYINMNI